MTIIALAWLLPTVLALLFILLASTNKSNVPARVITEAAAGLLLVGFPFLFVAPPPFLLLMLLAFLHITALLLVARILFGRLQKEFVLPSTRRNCLVLSLFLAGCVMFWISEASFMPDWTFGGLLIGVMGVHVGFLAQHIWARKHFKLVHDPALRSLADLPTVSVCIPARNEDHALADCMAHVLASDYPKLEVIVLDDCSQDKTSQIVRSFAHDGVRFIQGETPAEGWLGKNQARQVLAEHASGEYLLFIDVDTLIRPDTITHLIDYVLDTKMSMVSILPQDRLGVQPGALFDTLRFYWQQVLPITPKRVPVAGQAWLIKARTFTELGGFKSVAHKVVPEASFARRLAATDTYRFIAGQASLGITTAKKWQSHLASAIRLLYPTYKRQPLLALGACAIIVALFVLPAVVVVFQAIAGRFSVLFWAAAASWLVGSLTYALARQQSHPHVWPLLVLLLPITAVQEIFLIIASLLQYEFGEVNWKGRNICYPVIALSPQNPLVPGALRARR